MIGEDPNGIRIIYCLLLRRWPLANAKLSVFGGDYPTPDGTGVRDYIHVVDLAQGHVAALKYLAKHQGVHTWNLGTGTGYSVLEMVRAFGLPVA